jgi:dienelactone hydrolase
MVQNTLKTCPSTKIVMSGYSQGGQIVHNAAKALPASTMAQVSSVVIFGDPGKNINSAVRNNTDASYQISEPLLLVPPPG